MSVRLFSVALFLSPVWATACYDTTPGAVIIAQDNQVLNSTTLHGICFQLNSDDDYGNKSDSTRQNLDYFSLYKTLKQYTCQDTISVVLRFCCSLRDIIVTVLLGQGFGPYREIDFSNKVGDRCSDVCCVVFKRFSDNVINTTSSTSYVNPSNALTSPNHQDVSVILSDVSGLMGWESACILYSEEYLAMMNMLTSVFSNKGTKVWLRTLVDTDAELISTMTSCYYSMRPSGINFVLLANQSILENILLKMNTFSRHDGVLVKVGLMSRWLVISNDVCVSCLEPKIGNVSNLSIFKRKTHTEQEASSEKDRSDTVTFEVLTSYWQMAGRQFGTAVTWSTQRAITVYDDIFPNVRNKLNNATLILTTKEWPPFTIKKRIDGKVHFEGICMDIMDEMSRQLNFSYVIVEPPDDQWGLKAKSGNWTGMIRQLAYREVDVMIGAISIQQEREEVMDFIHPFYNDYTTLLMKRPDKTLEKWKLLIAPLDWTIVACVVCALPLITLLVTTIEKIHPYYAGIDRSGQRGLHRFDDCLWYNLAALLNEGGQECPKDQASRTVIASWWLFTMVIVASYTSTLTAALAVEKTELPFNTIEEMVEQNQYRWGGTYGSYMFMLFPKSENEIYKNLWAGIQRFLKDDADLLNKDHAVQVARVRSGRYVYLNDKSKNLIEIAQDCSLAMGKQEFLPLNFGIGLQPDSPFRELFDHQMITIVESGLVELWKSKWWPEVNNCTDSGPARVKAITVADVQGGYLVLGFGTGSALVTMILEIVIKRTCARCKCPTCKP